MNYNMKSQIVIESVDSKCEKLTRLIDETISDTCDKFEYIHYSQKYDGKTEDEKKEFKKLKRIMIIIEILLIIYLFKTL